MPVIAVEVFSQLGIWWLAGAVVLSLVAICGCAVWTSRRDHRELRDRNERRPR